VSPSDEATLVKQAVDIVDVIGQFVPLRRSGNRHLGLCPFHQEKTPSFQVDAENQFYYCFGCGSGGDVLSFVMKHQNLSFGEALSYLADRYHIDLPEKEHSHGVSGAVTEEARKEREQLSKVLQLAADFFYSQLHHSETGKVARDYIRQRALPDAVVETERLGYAPAQWDGLLKHLKGLGVDAEAGITAGLLARGGKDKDRVYDRFRNRLIFPITNERGQIVAFGGRSLAAETQDEPKYLNSPETPVYHKGRMLYQLARAREACRQVRQVVLVEGYMDLLSFHAHELYRVVATLGTALTTQQVRLLSRVADEVVMAYDGDDAGEKAMLRGLPLFLQEEVPVVCVRFPDGMDPDDFLKTRGLAAFEALVQHGEDLGTYAIRKALDGWDGTTNGKGKVLSELQPLFDSVRQPLLKAEYLRLISDRLSLSEKVIQSQLEHGKHHAGSTGYGGYAGSTTRQAGHAAKAPGPSRRAVASRISRTESLEEKILRMMVKYPDLIEDVRASDAITYFQEPRLKAIAEVLAHIPCPSPGVTLAASVYDALQDLELKELFTRFLLESADICEARVQLHDWLGALLEREIKQKRMELRAPLRQAEHEGNSEQVRQLLLQIQNLCSAKKRVKILPENVQGERNR